MKNRIINYIRAGYPALYLVSPEEQRVDAELKSIAQHLSFHLLFWSTVDGLVDSESGHITQAQDPLEALQAIEEAQEKSIVLLKDFHLAFEDPNPILLRCFKNLLQHAKANSKTLIVLGCRLILPPELEWEITVVEFALPGKDQLRPVLNGVLESASLEPLAEEEQDQVLDAAGGLTTIEAENAFALSVVEKKAIDPAIVAREKAQAVKKNACWRSSKPKKASSALAAWTCSRAGC